MNTNRLGCLMVGIAVLVGVSSVLALPLGTAFTYQGQLKQGGIPFSGTADFQFTLWDAAGSGNPPTGGVQVGGVQAINAQAVSSGLFTVALNVASEFGVSAFNGNARWVQVAVRSPAGIGGFTTLAPRQPLTAAPHALFALNAAQLNGIAASQYVITTDARMNDARNPLPGSQSYIHNSGVVQGGDFNIDGDGVAEVFSARSQFNIGNNRVLGIGGSASTFAGIGAGTNSTGDNNSFFGQGAGGGLTNSGSSNSFFGERAGALNTTGTGNSFVGSAAGVSNTTGGANAFVGSSAGASNSTGDSNSYFGAQAGQLNTTGINNSFFGRSAGVVNTASENSFFGAGAGAANTNGTFNSFFGYRSGNLNTTGISNTLFGWDAGRRNVDGCCNTFMGVQAGQFNTGGTRNVFIGHETGNLNTTGSRNTLIGFSASVGSSGLNYATAIGADAVVNNSNSVVLGRTADTVRVPGLQSVTGDADAEPGSGGSIVVGLTTSTNVAIDKNEIMARDNGATAPLYLNADGGNVILIQGGTGNVGIGISEPLSKLDVGGSFAVSGTAILGDRVLITTLETGGSTDLCRNAVNELSTCSSSLRYKSVVETFTGGFDIVRRLRPITFNWREGGMRDIGFAAEEVNEIEPLLTTRNDKGEIEGVKYKQITTVLVNAVNEQQTEIEQLKGQIQLQQHQIAALKKLVCSQNPQVEICRNME